MKLPSGRRLVSVGLLDGSQLSLAAEVRKGWWWWAFPRSLEYACFSLAD